MTPETEDDKARKMPLEKGDKTMIKAFTFAGAIMALGLFGLTKTVILLAATLGWVGEGTGAGPFYVWLLSGMVAGLVFSWILVKTRRRS